MDGSVGVSGGLGGGRWGRQCSRFWRSAYCRGRVRGVRVMAPAGSVVPASGVWPWVSVRHRTVG
eukprot:5774962-Prorocentrum_lima.AAC.1